MAPWVETRTEFRTEGERSCGSPVISRSAVVRMEDRTLACCCMTYMVVSLIVVYPTAHGVDEA